MNEELTFLHFCKETLYIFKHRKENKNTDWFERSLKDIWTQLHLFKKIKRLVIFLGILITMLIGLIKLSRFF